MSVRRSERKENKLNVFLQARNLYLYTLKILDNENNFDPKYHPEVLERLRNHSYRIFMDAWGANNIVIDAKNINATAWRLREEFQIKSILACNEMLAEISIAKPLYHIPGKRIEYWANQVVEIRKQLVNWHKSDVKRYA